MTANTIATKRTRDDVSYDAGGWLVDVCEWAGSVRLQAVTRHPGGRLESVGVLFIDHNAEALAMCRAVVRGGCDPAILADWVEDRPETWRCPGAERNRAAAVICSRLREVG